ncbi:hypothetical protein CLOM_g1700 [Closterium sp. NIES-68]|nr:hypothetical protein CLOM_g1700 [Closterium sp. NIES-68]GJP68967.1 hypothetical protein CLOP_g25601 [Closterium sp. NIES-67]
MSKAAQAKKRGLSLEEKREKMLEIFYESKDFFLLKELERMGPKRGVISQSVKDVIQSLVDDDLVLRDKIGTSVYFWSLPSSAGNKLRQAEAQLTAEVGELQAKKARLEQRLESAQAGRQESEDRSRALADLAGLQAKNQKLKKELEEFAENDPELLEHKTKVTRIAKDAANRWTENIFSLQQWCNDQFPEASEKLAQLYQEVGITDDIDYVE